MYVEGIVDKYPKELLEGRPIVEGNVIATLFKNVDYYDEWKLTLEDFVTIDGRLFYRIGQQMLEGGYKVLDIISLNTYFADKPKLRELFESRDGFRAISELVALINTDNADKYYDELVKSNILISLHDKGFQVVRNIDKFRKMQSEDIYNALDTQLNSIFVKKQLGAKAEDIYIDDEFLDDCNRGSEMGLPYNSACPILSYLTCGIHKKSLMVLAGHSGSGKTNFIINNIVLPVVTQNKKVCIISNEQNIREFKRMFLGTVLGNEVGYYGMTRKKLQTGGFTEQDWDAVRKGQEYLNQFKGMLKFVQLYDYKIDGVQKIIRSLSKIGFELFIFDTFKAENLAVDNSWGTMVEDSKVLFQTANKCDVAIVSTMQLAIHTLDVRYLNANCLSTAKGIKEVCSDLILMRPLWKDEYSGENKDVKPYFIPRDEYGVYKKEKQAIETFPDKKYMVVFVDKTRSDERDLQLLYYTDLKYNKWSELGYCSIQPQ